MIKTLEISETSKSSKNSEGINLACILLCAGSGTRLIQSLNQNQNLNNNKNNIDNKNINKAKQFLEINGHPLFFYALQNFLKLLETYQENPKININIYLVTQNEYKTQLENQLQTQFQTISEKIFNNKNNLIKFFKEKTKIQILNTGGETRQQSVYQTLKFLSDLELKHQTTQTTQTNKLNKTWVLVHDSARPYLHMDDLQALLKTINLNNSNNPDFKGAILGKKVFDTVKSIPNHKHNINNIKTTEPTNPANSLQTLARDALFFAQTPQLFALQDLTNALAFCEQQNLSASDEAQAIEHYFQNLQQNYHIELVNAKHINDKITVQEDWHKLQNMLELLK